MPSEYAPVRLCNCSECESRGCECLNCVAYGQWSPDDNLVVPCLNCIRCLRRENCYPKKIVGQPHRQLSNMEKEGWYEFWESVERLSRQNTIENQVENAVREAVLTTPIVGPTFTVDMVSSVFPTAFSTPPRPPIRNNRIVEPIGFESSDDDSLFSGESDDDDNEDNEDQSFISLCCHNCGMLGAAHTDRIAEIQGWSHLREDNIWYCHYENCQEEFDNALSSHQYECTRCNTVERFYDEQHMLDSEWDTSLLDGDLLCYECAPLVEEEQRRFYNGEDNGYDSEASTVIIGAEQPTLPENTNEINV